MKQNKDQKNNKRDDSSNWWLLIIAAVVLAGVAFIWFQTADRGGAQPSSASNASMQLTTLSPGMFTGKAREAYQAAKDVPQVLAEVPCYCGCMQYNGHEHNLHCFVDNHGVG